MRFDLKTQQNRLISTELRGGVEQFRPSPPAFARGNELPVRRSFSGGGRLAGQPETWEEAFMTQEASK